MRLLNPPIVAFQATSGTVVPIGEKPQLQGHLHAPALAASCTHARSDEVAAARPGWAGAAGLRLQGAQHGGVIACSSPAAPGSCGTPAGTQSSFDQIQRERALPTRGLHY